MPIKSLDTSIPGILLFEPDMFKDSRGYFMEIFHRKKYAEIGLDRSFVQENFSHSKRGIIRGLHYQLRQPQAKFLYVMRGEIFDVAVDIRRGSPTFGKWFGTNLSDENRRQIFVPEGFAHGFCVLSESADVFYKCTDFYNPGDEYGIFWSDKTIGIDWPIENPFLSEKDSLFKPLKAIAEKNLPAY